MADKFKSAHDYTTVTEGMSVHAVVERVEDLFSRKSNLLRFYEFQSILDRIRTGRIDTGR